MSSVAQKFFKASLIYLGLGLLAQAVAVFDVWLGFNPLAYTAITATQQVLLLGWLTQLGLALVYDRWLVSPQPEEKLNHQIQNPKSHLIVFILFNLGLPLVIFGQPGLALWGRQWLGVVAALGGLFQLIAGIIFVRDAWRTLRKN